MDPLQRASEPDRVSAVAETTACFGQSTADVDNFVGNPAARLAKPRRLDACDDLLKT